MGLKRLLFQEAAFDFLHILLFTAVGIAVVFSVDYLQRKRKGKN